MYPPASSTKLDPMPELEVTIIIRSAIGRFRYCLSHSSSLDPREGIPCKIYDELDSSVLS